MKKLIIFAPLVFAGLSAGAGILVDKMFINPNPPNHEVVVAAFEGFACMLLLGGLLGLGWSIYTLYDRRMR